MPIVHIAVLALIQGITEFLPISAAGHYGLVPKVLHWSQPAPVIDLAIHVGLLGAVVIYLWRDLWAMFAGLLRLARGRRDPGARLALYLIVATIPTVAAVYFLRAHLPEGFGGLALLGWATLGFGLLLYIADKAGMTLRRVEHLRLGDALVIGIAQAVALVPGASRSGITMTAGRILGMERPEAARFSMLLAIPVIAGLCILDGLALYRSGPVEITLMAGFACGIAFIAAIIAIAAMMAWLRNASFTPFVIYRILLGAFILALAYNAVPGLSVQ